MRLEFNKKGKELILLYHPERIESETLLQQIKGGNTWVIKHCFTVSADRIRHCETEFDPIDETICFCIGSIGPEYTRIDPAVIRTTNTFYFANSVPLSEKMFIAYRNISILRKLDKVMNSDVYIGESVDKSATLPLSAFKDLIRQFPKTAELDHYANAKIAGIVKEYFGEAELYEMRFEKFLKKHSQGHRITIAKTDFSQQSKKIEFAQFKLMDRELHDLLDAAEGIDENTWQKRIHDIIRLLYPKYIAAFREVTIRGVDGYDKRPDFLLVDANGYVDILEIKKPSAQLLTKQSSHRNNYVPVKELAGAIQQIEKYVFCLNHWGDDGEKRLEKIFGDTLPEGLSLKIINPQGLLILGRSKNFNPQQKSDFELIKRQYKHVADIMSYDDLVARISNITLALEKAVL